MTRDGKLKIVFGILSAGLLATLLIKLTTVPGGMILSGLFLGGMMIVGIILGCLILSGILRMVFKKISFLTMLFITTTLSFLAFHYQLYSPTLTIKVPNGYTGEINLVLSNVEDNVLTVDSNGIGYLNKWTFNKTYSRPRVEQLDGKKLDRNLAGYNSSAFWGKGKSCCVDGLQIESLHFEIFHDGSTGQKQYFSKNLATLVNKKLVLFSKPNKHSIIQTEAISVDTIKK